MSTTAAIVVGVAVVVVLGALAFVTLARRSDVRGAGALSNETLRRDAAARSAAPPVAAPERKGSRLAPASHWRRSRPTPVSRRGSRPIRTHSASAAASSSTAPPSR
jgi:hypothetical protein